MDELDVRILKTLSLNVRRSFGAIARKMGVDEGTVRNRIRTLHETGFVEDWRLVVNPRLLGAGDVCVWFDALPDVSRGDLVEQLQLMPGVYVIGVCHRNFFFVVFRHGSEYSPVNQLELIRRVARAETVTAGRIPYPDPGIQLSASDWAVLGAIYKHPRKTHAAIAKEVGLSTRTIKRKLQRMMQANAVGGFPALNPAGLRGAVMANLFVTYPLDCKDEVDLEVARAFDDYLMYTLHLMPLGTRDVVPCAYSLMLPNVPKGREAVDAAKQLSGVRTARLELVEEVLTIFAPLEEEMEKHANRLVARAGGGAPSKARASVRAR